MHDPVARIDVKLILSESERKSSESYSRMKVVLSRMEDSTMRWTRSMRGNWPVGSSSFALPLAARLRLEYVDLYTGAARFGAMTVALEMNSAPRGSVDGRVRSRASAAANQMVKRIEVDLVDNWLKFTTPRSSAKEIDFQTKTVFAKYGGWDPPKSP